MTNINVSDWDRVSGAVQGAVNGAMVHISNLAIMREITDGRAQGLLTFVGFVAVIVFICIGIKQYMNRTEENFGYNVFDIGNIALHVGIWIICWFMWVIGCFGAYSDTWVLTTPGCPMVSCMIIVGLWMVPTIRTQKVVRSWGEAVVINMFQSTIGLLIGCVLIFFGMYNSKKEDA